LAPVALRNTLLVVGSDDFHDALNAAIRSTEHYADAKDTVERSKKLKREADSLIESSRQLVDSSKRRIGKHSGPSQNSQAR
jgi:hypothetical protein